MVSHVLSSQVNGRDMRPWGLVDLKPPFSLLLAAADFDYPRLSAFSVVNKVLDDFVQKASSIQQGGAQEGAHASFGPHPPVFSCACR